MLSRPNYHKYLSFDNSEVKQTEYKDHRNKKTFDTWKYIFGKEDIALELLNILL